MSSVLREDGASRIYQMGNMSTLEIGGGEYLPVGYQTEDYVDDLTYDPEKVMVSEWSRQERQIRVEAVNLTGEVQQVEVPYLYYKGYTAEDEAGGRLLIVTGASGRISVSLPAGYQGSFTVGFHEPWYWRVCEGISLLMLVLILACSMKKFEIKEKRFLWHRS